MLRIIKCVAFLTGSTAGLAAQDGEIRGSAVDFFTGRPVVLSSVDLSGKTGQIEPGGAYRFSKVPRGEYDLTVKASSYYEATIRGVHLENPQTLMIPPLQLESIPFICPGQRNLADYYELDGSTAISITILGNEEAPIENALVKLYAKRVGKIAEKGTGDKGIVSFRALNPDGEYWVFGFRERIFQR